jgi:uncharacterized RmlC-like cupin family protein
VGSEPVRKVAASERVEGQYTAGMVREEAIITEGLWAGLVRTERGMISAWHHHGEYETAIYVLTGKLRMESGVGGTEIAEAGPGDFVLVPRHAVHRETNPSDEESRLIVVRSGSGEVVVNVDGPDCA